MERIDAGRWFRVRPVADGVTWIDEPYVKEFYRCNIWHLRGRERDLLEVVQEQQHCVRLEGLDQGTPAKEVISKVASLQIQKKVVDAAGSVINETVDTLAK